MDLSGWRIERRDGTDPETGEDRWVPISGTTYGNRDDARNVLGGMLRDLLRRTGDDPSDDYRIGRVIYPTTGLPRRHEATCSGCGATYPPELVRQHEQHPYHHARVLAAARNEELHARLEGRAR